MKALYGDEIRKLRQLEDGTKIFSVALPVQSYRKISGAILLTLDSLNIEGDKKKLDALMRSLYTESLDILV